LDPIAISVLILGTAFFTIFVSIAITGFAFVAARKS
jgi:hypothetical protein